MCTDAIITYLYINVMMDLDLYTCTFMTIHTCIVL